MGNGTPTLKLMKPKDILAKRLDPLSLGVWLGICVAIAAGCWTDIATAQTGDCQDACLAACPKRIGAFGTTELDPICVRKCLLMDCAAKPPGPPVQPHIQKPGGADAAIELIIHGTTPLRAMSRGSFAVTAAAFPRGGKFTWRLKNPDVARLLDEHKPSQGTFSMPQNGVVLAQASEQTLIPLKPGRVEIAVDYALNSKVTSKSATMEMLPPLLFLHGIASNAEAWYNMKEELMRLGLLFGGRLCTTCAPARQGDFYTADFTHPQDSYIRQRGEVAAYIGQIVSLAPPGARAEGKRVVLIAHSMGGLAARAYLQDPSYRGDVAALVTVGTPHRGSIAAQFVYPVIEAGRPPPYIDEALYRKYFVPLMHFGTQPQKVLVQWVVSNFGFDLSVYSEGVRELAVITDDMKRLNQNAASTLPRAVRYVFVVGVLPHDVAQKILNDSLVKTFGLLERNDPVWRYLSGFIENTDGLVDEGSQNLNTLVRGIGPVIRTEAIHCCMPQGKRAQPISETEQIDVIMRALQATGLVGGLIR